MPIATGERDELMRERRLLLDVVALVRRCDGSPPSALLDAVLRGSTRMRPLVPAQRCRGRS